jgi:hypothetical protein
LLSGGQTGVDRAALDAGIRMGLEVGGWCPKGRRAEDSRIPENYPLRETPSRAYAQRTEWNVRDSDATLILYRERIVGGTRLTRQLATEQGKPVFLLDLAGEVDPNAVRNWIVERAIRILNVAGPREKDAPGIHRQVLDQLPGLLP